MIRLTFILFLVFPIFQAQVVVAQPTMSYSEQPDDLKSKTVIRLKEELQYHVLIFQDDRYLLFLDTEAYLSRLEEELKALDSEETTATFESWKAKLRNSGSTDTIRLIDIPIIFDGFWMENTLEDDLLVQRLLRQGYAQVWNRKKQRFEKKLTIRSKNQSKEKQGQFQVDYLLPGKQALFSSRFSI